VLRERRAQREEERLRAVERKVHLSFNGEGESRHQTGHLTFYYYFSCFYLFVLIDLSCASGAAPQQGVTAPEGAPDFCFILF
jgi:hypothetical protein